MQALARFFVLSLPWKDLKSIAIFWPARASRPRYDRLSWRERHPPERAWREQRSPNRRRNALLIREMLA